MSGDIQNFYDGNIGENNILEIELRRLTDKFYSRIAFEQDREDYLEILNDTHGYYDY